jgi:2-dehydropantoate 2-reductase
MKEIKTVSLIGMGAIGAAYGSRLHNHLGKNFTVVANEERIRRIQKKGIGVLDETYYFHCETKEAASGARDLVIFAVKNAELQGAIEEIKHHIGPDTIILSLLNGISSEEEIQKATGSSHILYSMCVGIDAVRENGNVQFSSLGKICFGARDDQLQDDVQAVKNLFDRASVPYEVPEDIWHTIWAKFMFNVGINQISAVLRAPYKFFQEVPSLHQWMEEAMHEVVLVSEKEGVGLSEQDVKNYRPILNGLSPEGKTSMLQDIEGNRKTEVEYFAGKVVELGKKHQIATPINEQLLRLIPIIEDMNAFESQGKKVNI